MLWAITAVLSGLSILLLGFFYRLRRGQHALFLRMGLPGPRPHWIRGNLVELKGARLVHELLMDWRREYGKTFGYYEGPTPVMVTSDLSIIRSVFIKQFHNFHGRKLFALQPDPEDPRTNHMFTARGQKWKRLRSIIVPTFSCSRLKQMLPIINAKIDILLHQMAIQSLRGANVNMLDNFQALTMEIIGSAAFGMDLNSQTDPNEPFLVKARDMLEILEKGGLIRKIAEYFPELRPTLVNIMSTIVKVTKATPAPLWLLKNLADLIAMRKMESIASEKVERIDMMQLMLDAEVDENQIHDNRHLTMICEQSNADNNNVLTKNDMMENGRITMSSDEHKTLTMHTDTQRTAQDDETIPSVAIKMGDSCTDISVCQSEHFAKSRFAMVTVPDHQTGHCTQDSSGRRQSLDLSSQCYSKCEKNPSPTTSATIQNINDNIRSLKRSLKRLTAEEIKGQSFLFLVAGYETTAHTLSFACYLLALHPDKQSKLQAEVDANILNEEAICYETLNAMEYLDRVVSETLRLYPVANSAVSRLCMRDTTVNELTIKEGTVVQANVVDLHMDADIWGPTDPKLFDPDRFLPEHKARRDPLAYMPFGVGPRNCVGMRFALLEVKQALARLVRHFTFTRCAQTQVPLKLKEIPALTPVDGIYLKLVARKKVI